jgi:hypothetical protein
MHGVNRLAVLLCLEVPLFALPVAYARGSPREPRLLDAWTGCGKVFSLAGRSFRVCVATTARQAVYTARRRLRDGKFSGV